MVDNSYWRNVMQYENMNGVNEFTQKNKQINIEKSFILDSLL